MDEILKKYNVGNTLNAINSVFSIDGNAYPYSYSHNGSEAIKEDMKQVGKDVSKAFKAVKENAKVKK